MVKIYGAFTPGQTLCRALSKHYLFSSSPQVQERGALFYPHSTNEETEAPEGSHLFKGSHSSPKVEGRDQLGSSKDPVLKRPTVV